MKLGHCTFNSFHIVLSLRYQTSPLGWTVFANAIHVTLLFENGLDLLLHLTYTDLRCLLEPLPISILEW